MTLPDKIDRFLAETREQQVKPWSAAPPGIRLLWLFKVDVPPPLYWPFWMIAIVDSVMFFVLFSLVLRYVLRQSWQQIEIGGPIAALLFGICMAWFSRRQARRLRLSAWNG